MSFNRESLVAFFQENLGLGPSIVKDDTALFSSGLIDSFSMVELLTHIEDRAAIKIDQDDITLDNLDSVSRILNFVELQLGR